MKLIAAPDPDAPRRRRMLDWQKVARKLRKHPGTWFYSPYPETGSMVNNIKSGRVPALMPDEFEARLYRGALILRARGVDPLDPLVDH